mmetsp:Transcript_34618/g.98091  ORF Transcript_34618/g.98091 Transcript_34618/m.98091 type:complete len:578 (-) Transcript_34618:717-2450(-)
MSVPRRSEDDASPARELPQVLKEAWRTRQKRPDSTQDICCVCGDWADTGWEFYKNGDTVILCSNRNCWAGSDAFGTPQPTAIHIHCLERPEKDIPKWDWYCSYACRVVCENRGKASAASLSETQPSAKRKAPPSMQPPPPLQRRKFSGSIGSRRPMQCTPAGAAAKPRLDVGTLITNLKSGNTSEAGPSAPSAPLARTGSMTGAFDKPLWNGTLCVKLQEKLLVLKCTAFPVLGQQENSEVAAASFSSRGSLTASFRKHRHARQMREDIHSKAALYIGIGSSDVRAEGYIKAIANELESQRDNHVVLAVDDLPQCSMIMFTDGARKFKALFVPREPKHVPQHSKISTSDPHLKRLLKNPGSQPRKLSVKWVEGIKQKERGSVPWIETVDRKSGRGSARDPARTAARAEPTQPVDTPSFLRPTVSAEVQEEVAPGPSASPAPVTRHWSTPQAAQEDPQQYPWDWKIPIASTRYIALWSEPSADPQGEESRLAAELSAYHPQLRPFTAPDVTDEDVYSVIILVGQQWYDVDMENCKAAKEAFPDGLHGMLRDPRCLFFHAIDGGHLLHIFMAAQQPKGR